MQAGGQTMKYPYTIAAKLQQFPWKFHWKNGRFIRFTAYTWLICLPIFYKIHKGANSPGNVRTWDAIRKKRDHTHFDPVHE